MRVLVLAKAPQPGRSKTRLQQRWSAEQAAALAEAALVDTLEAVRRVDATAEVVLDGEPGPWLLAGLQVRAQVAGSHAARIAAAFAGRPEPCLLIGMDTPQVTPGLLAAGLDALTTADASFGRAVDGGWWALGLRRPADHGDLVLGVRTSTPTTGAEQHQALLDAGLRVRALPVLRDVDLPEDALHVAGLVPGSRFAQVLRVIEPAA